MSNKFQSASVLVTRTFDLANVLAGNFEFYVVATLTVNNFKNYGETKAISPSKKETV